MAELTGAALASWARLTWTAWALALATAPAAAAEEIAGLWLSDDGEGAVEIAPCGAERCGRIVWLKSPKTAEGRPVIDANNPDPALRTREVCGLSIVTGLKPQSDGGWDQGRIYDPEEGKSYDLAMRREGSDTLKVTGYLGTKMLSETHVWRRAPRTLARCGKARAGSGG
jgi:uncharacterized protein (DUF2147 family)